MFTTFKRKEEHAAASRGERNLYPAFIVLLMPKVLDIVVVVVVHRDLILMNKQKIR